MRVVACLVLAALCLQVANGAVMVRFINTVPNHAAVPLSLTANVKTAFGAASGFASGAGRDTTTYETLNNRVGLHYYPSTTGSNLNNPTTVWTEPNRGQIGATFGQQHGIHNTGAGGSMTATAFAYQMGMPPLRAYHSQAGNVQTASVDKVASYTKCLDLCTVAASDAATIAADTAAQLANDGEWPTKTDHMDRLGLKADGVGQYLSFAAGSYKIQAYGVRGTANGANPFAAGSSIDFTSSLTTVEFKDWHTYTLIATGNGQWVASGTGATVSLRLIEENTAPSTFGKASLRFFHAIESENTNAVDIYSGLDVATATKVITGLSYGSTSSYIDVNPSTGNVFPIAYDGANGALTTVQTGVSVTLDTRVGTRATVICAIENTVSKDVFCRMIPSRVVAYVRMVNDMASLDTHVQGKFGPQKFSETTLSLWASWDYPRPEILDEANQDSGAAVTAGSAVMSNGLYPVLPEVTPGSVSGYGEVAVPLYIMDMAVNQGVFRSGDGTPAAIPANVNNGAIRTSAGWWASDFWVGNRGQFTANNQPLNQDQSGYDYSARYKRVNLLVKTDGFATVTDRRRLVAADWVQDGVSAAGAGYHTAAAFVPYNTHTTETTGWQSTSTMDIPMEPGQYYTLFVTPALASTNPNPKQAAAADALLNTQNGAYVEFGMTIDRSIDDLSQGLPAGKARLRFVGFGLSNANQHPGPNGVNTFPGVASVASTLRQFGSAGFGYAGTNGLGSTVKATAVAAANAHVTVTPETAGVAQEDNHLLYSNYVRLDPNVEYLPAFRANDAGTALDLAPGAYNFKFTTNQADKCEYGMPSARVELEAGDVATVYVLNIWGCKKGDTAQAGQLKTTIVKEMPYGPRTETNTQETFFAAASSVSASISLVFAAVVAVLAFVF